MRSIAYQLGCHISGKSSRLVGTSIQSPVDMALNCAWLRPGVDCALDAGHGGVPCVENFAGLKLDLDYLPALYNAYIRGKIHSGKKGSVQHSQCVIQ